MNTKNNLQSIQILRAIAALSVCIVHFNAKYSLTIHGKPHCILFFPLASGVDLFFVISGFIMVYAHERLFGMVDARFTFLIRRVARIVPLYWITTLLYIYFCTKHVKIMPLLKSFFFIPYGHWPITPIYAIGWTLNFEMFFYVIFSLGVIFTREICVLFVSLFLLMFVLVNDIISLPLPFYFWADPIVLEFVFGMWIALAYRHHVHLPFFISILFIILSAVTICFFQPHMPPSHSRYLLWGVPTAFIVASTVLTKTAIPFRIPLLSLLGDASYSLYLMHSLVALLIWSIFKDHTHLLPIAVLGVLSTLPVSILVHLYMEKPLTKFVIHFLLLQSKVGPKLQTKKLSS